MSQASRSRNHLLNSFTPTAYERIRPKLRAVTLHAKQVLYRPNQRIHDVYFPETAVICQMAVMVDGSTLETATVGHEGASWISASFGAPSMPCETIVVIGGQASALAIDDLGAEMRKNATFRDLLTQYSHALLIHSLRMTGCTGLHSLPQRCARWILTTLDRVPENRFSVTHEFLAMLLGANRSSVSLVIGDFEARGLLKTTRGRLVVGDRDGLVGAACDCYDIIKRNYAQVGQQPLELEA